MVKEGSLRHVLQAVGLGRSEMEEGSEDTVRTWAALPTHTLLAPLTLTPLSWTMRPYPSMKRRPSVRRWGAPSAACERSLAGSGSAISRSRGRARTQPAQRELGGRLGVPWWES